MDQNLRTYETICITKVDMPDDKYAALMERCKAAVSTEGQGKVVYSDDWGRAKIAYTIGKDNRGRWTYLRYQSTSKGVDEIQRALKINEFVLRQLTVRTKEDNSEYDPLRENMAKDLADRDRPRDWREERGPRGPRRDFGDRGGYGDRGGGYGGGGGGGGGYRDRDDRYAPTAPEAQQNDGAGDEGNA